MGRLPSGAFASLRSTHPHADGWSSLSWGDCPSCVSCTYFFLNIALLMLDPISLSQSMCTVSRDTAELAGEKFCVSPWAAVLWCEGRGEAGWGSLDPALTVQIRSWWELVVERVLIFLHPHPQTQTLGP